MAAPASLGLARVTVAAPKRRIDIALPEGVPVGELLPHVLRHAGEGVADDGERHGGWVLRRGTGTAIEPGRHLAAQGVRDGEILYLVPRRASWPELAYDDVVEIIASGARRTGRSWGDAATRRCALAVTAALLGFGLVDLLLSGPPWRMPGAVALGFGLVAAVIGIVLSRAMADASAGAVVAACGLPYAAAGGFLVAGLPQPLSRFGAPHMLLGSATLLLLAMVGYVGVAALSWLFVAGMFTGVTGALGALLCFAGMSPTGAAAVVLTVALGLLPGFPLISVWLGRLPVPALPERPEEMLEDRPAPPRSEVFAAVTRSYELLAGLLLGAAVVSAVTIVLLLRDATLWAAALSAAATAALLLRSRLFPTPRQRVPLIASGVFGLALLLLGVTLAVPAGVRLVVLLLAIAAGAGLVLSAGLAYSTRAPSPYVGRLADICDVLAIMALVPLAAGVVGVYGSIQGLFASLG